jgi:hypothetical protein
MEVDYEPDCYYWFQAVCDKDEFLTLIKKNGYHAPLEKPLPKKFNFHIFFDTNINTKDLNNPTLFINPFKNDLVRECSSILDIDKMFVIANLKFLRIEVLVFRNIFSPDLSEHITDMINNEEARNEILERCRTHSECMTNSLMKNSINNN